ncbi:MAG: succinate dehydrogenase, cytochrome b556 subunit [Methylovulum sp.]|uniref:succinate dehydrogenase, cytochrome b556 subunit n=1 Tax=Methylovulum sp. TaxID=1916980 RepID=UPI0026135198|nr:succinate dehydrogenase, cytochrome b556 subunit [Methylovulum sp.]MDD2723043.1 succinate dehydrogenase, cytochrome b556 subunit [Methylovulum sp.]MDD5123768.1 succinate dehydrogenase, cytochrome b556 subunit [Methylovulum sp.]
MASNSNRPTSPHLQIYKLPLTGIISISHRITGVMLSAGLLLIVYILSAVSGGIDNYDEMQAVMNNWLITPMYWGFIFALFFHLCHGVRHLIWDAGETFAKETLDYYAKIELGAAFVLTLIALIFI